MQQAKMKTSDPLHLRLASSQRGVALLTILLMVAMATILAAGLMSRQQRYVREASVLLRQDQALQYALGGEAFLIELLAADEKTSASHDSLDEVWAQPTPPYPVEDGVVMGQMVDESGRFNLNNLYHDGKADADAVALLGRLLVRSGLSADLADAVLDWQDPDDTATGSSGAETSFYLGQQPAYRAANRPFQDTAELQRVRGFEDPAAYAKIAAYVTVVPTFSPININTASAVLLSALDDTLAVQAATAWTTARDTERKPLDQVSALWSQSGFALLATEKRDGLNRFLAVKSQYYRAEVSASLEGRLRYLTSHVYRQGGRVVAYRRSLAPIISKAPEQP
jgi:general secretion pathway protein K